MDDQDDPSFPDGLEGAGIHYHRIDRGAMTLGEKRNLTNGLTRGEIIVHLDSDDWSAPGRIADQVDLLQRTGLPVTGYSNVLYWDTVHQQAKVYRSSVKRYVCGMSLCYKKSWWEQHRFPAQQKGSDNSIVYPNMRDIAASQDLGRIVARIHGQGHAGGSKSGINQIVPREMIPAAFWENEALRIGSAS